MIAGLVSLIYTPACSKKVFALPGQASDLTRHFNGLHDTETMMSNITITPAPTILSRVALTYRLGYYFIKKTYLAFIGCLCENSNEFYSYAEIFRIYLIKDYGSGSKLK